MSKRQPNPESLERAVSHVIKRRRKSLGLTQAELAAKSGVNQSLLSKLERHQTAITVERLASLSNTLKTMPSEVLREAESIEKPYQLTIMELLAERKLTEL